MEYDGNSIQYFYCVRFTQFYEVDVFNNCVRCVLHCFESRDFIGLFQFSAAERISIDLRPVGDSC